MMKTIREEPFGQATLRIVHTDTAYAGAVIRKGTKPETIQGDDVDVIWSKLKQMAGRHNPGYIGFEGARKRFLQIFPAGFADPCYLSNGKAGERNYKLAAAEKLRATLPLEAAVDASGAGEAALAVFQATNVVSPYEKARLQVVLRGPRADEFIRAAAEFTMGKTKPGLVGMAQALKPDNVVTWPAVTYLPFLWRPEEHMFLEPEVTRDYAERVGHPFAHEYKSELSEATYCSLLDLARETRKQIADLEPRDSIDIQSFIWVVGKYDHPDEAPDGSQPGA